MVWKSLLSTFKVLKERQILSNIHSKVFPYSRKEDEELTDKIKSLCNSLVTNNPNTGNFAVLLHVFIDKTETLLSSKEK